MSQEIKETNCCPKFDPEKWGGEKEIVWQDKIFVKNSVCCFFHIPLNFGKAVKESMEKIEAAGAQDQEMLMLSDEKSLWKSDLYISASKEVSGAQIEKISGVFLTKVFEGPFKDIGKWIKEMNDFVEAKGKVSKKMYFYYTTCPKCARAYGKNYVVIFAQTE